MGMCWSHVGKPEPTALMPGPALISGEGQWIVVKKKTRCVWGGKRVVFRERSVRLVKTDFCSGSRCWCVTVFGGTEAESWDTAASVETYKLFICCHVTTSNNRGGRWNHQVEVEDCRILIWGMWNATTLKTWHNRGPPLTVGLYEEWDVFEGTWLDVRRHLQTTVTEVKELALKMDGGVSGFWVGPVNRRSTGVQPALHRKMLQVLVRKTSESFSWNLCCESLFTFFSLLTPALICSYSLHDKIRADCNLGQVLKLGNT